MARGAVLLIFAAVFIFSGNPLVLAQAPQQAVTLPAQSTAAYRVTSIEVKNEADVTSVDFLKHINAEKVPYADSPANKIGLGAINTVTAWTDLPREMGRVSEEENMLAGATAGLVQGLTLGLARGVSGIYDIATFGLPPYDKPLMQPEYRVKNPEKEGLKIDLLKW